MNVLSNHHFLKCMCAHKFTAIIVKKKNKSVVASVQLVCVFMRVVACSMYLAVVNVYVYRGYQITDVAFMKTLHFLGGSLIIAVVGSKATEFDTHTCVP